MTRLDPTIERDILERAFLDVAMALFEFMHECDEAGEPYKDHPEQWDQLQLDSIRAYRALMASRKP